MHLINLLWQLNHLYEIILIKLLSITDINKYVGIF